VFVEIPLEEAKKSLMNNKGEFIPGEKWQLIKAFGENSVLFLLYCILSPEATS